jgi:L-lactate permease
MTENLLLLFAFGALLAGVFGFNKIGVGALAGGAILFFGKGWLIGEWQVFALLNGIIVSFELALLIFGAYFFYLFLQSRNQLAPFTAAAAAFPSRFSVALIFCFYFGSFLEGLTGFGIPAMLVAPILLSLGYKPATSVVLPLAANTVSVTFGALGTAVKVGLGASVVSALSYHVVWFNALPILVLPFLLAWVYGRTEGEKIRWAKQWKMLLAAGIFYLVPYALAARVSLEFPSVAGGLAGLFLFVLTCIPRAQAPKAGVWVTTFSPYLFFVLLLLAVKFAAGSGQLHFHPELRPVSYFQPGLLFIVAVAILAVRGSRPTSVLHLLSGFAKDTFSVVRQSLITVLCLVCFSQIAQTLLTGFAGGLLADAGLALRSLLAPVIGVFGSFVTGSATMSNLLFQQSFVDVAGGAAPLATLHALLNIGSAFGNALSLQNIIMIKAAVRQPVSTTRILATNSAVVFFLLALVSAVVWVVGAAWP